MELHSPPNLDLPPLKIEKQDARKIMEASANISNFIKSNHLLSEALRELTIDVTEKSGQIERSIKDFEDFKEDPFLSREFYLLFRKRTTATTRMLFKSQYSRMFLRRKKTYKISKKQKEELEKTTMEVKKEMFTKKIAGIKRRSSMIQNKLSKFENAKKITLDILTPLTLFICKKCRNIVSRDRFRQSKCACGTKIRTISNTLKVPIAYFNKMLMDFITNNYWFEYGIDYLLRKKNFQTLCGYHVLGHSGCRHEIDNIAESRASNFRFFCECKTSEIIARHVFIFAGKMADIGCSRGYMFTLQKKVQEETEHLARSRNISIVTNALGKSLSELLREIRED